MFVVPSPQCNGDDMSHHNNQLPLIRSHTLQLNDPELMKKFETLIDRPTKPKPANERP